MSLLAKLLEAKSPDTPPPSQEKAGEELLYMYTWVCEHGVEWPTWTKGGRPDVDDPFCVCGIWED